MKYILYSITGIISGILGGMGMGGGTALIPLLTIFGDVSQHAAQTVNLISFIPMAVIALIIHIKNKLVKFDKILYIILPGIVTCVIGCYIAKKISGDVLSNIFGGFLVVLSVFQFVSIFVKKDKNS